MFTSKQFFTISTLLIVFILLFSAQSFAQNNPQIVRTITYDVIKEFVEGDIYDTKMSADGSKILFADYATKIYTMNTDGTDERMIFDFTQFVYSYLDLSADGTKAVWGVWQGGFYIGNSDGSQQVLVNKLQNPNGSEFWISLPLRPRITADGSKVYFCNTGGGEDMGGVWRVNSDGTNPQQLISYTQIRAQLNLPYISDWGHIFRKQFDISDDGSRMIWTTDKIPSNPWKQVLLAFDGTTIRILMDPIITPSQSTGGRCAISGDGTKVVAIKHLGGSDAAIYAINFDGSNPVQLHSVSGLGAPMLQLVRDGSRIFVHWAGRQGSSYFINTNGTDSDNLGIVQAQWLHWSIGNPFRGLHMSNISADGKRINFASSTITVDQLKRIWFAEINPLSLGNAPAISDANMNPIWVLTKGGSKSTFSAQVSSTQEQIEEVGYASFPNGFYRNIFSSYHRLYDDGATAGDVTAGDGIFTNSQIVTNQSEETDGPVPIRFSAWTANHVTSVDVLPFFILNQGPTGPAPTITSIDPTSAEPGSQITIYGTGFNTTANQNIVIIGNRNAYVVNASATQLTVEIPPELPSGNYAITVSVNGQTSNARTISVGEGTVTLYPPQNLSTSVSNNSVTLNWNQPETGSATLLGYDIYRSTSPNAKNTGIKIGHALVSTTQYVDSGLSEGLYYYQVTALYTQGESDPSNEVSATVGDVSGLNPPRNLEAYIWGDTEVVLFWDPPIASGAIFTKQAEAAINEIEPNNSPAQSQPLTGTSPIVVNGNAEVGDVGTIDDGYDDIEDLYRVTMTATGLNIYLSGFTSDCDLSLFDAYGASLLDGSYNVGAAEPEEIDYYDLEAGTYVIGVSIVDFDPQGAEQTPYTLTVSGQFGEVPEIKNLLSYNIFRSTTPDARNTGILIGNVDAYITDFPDSNLTPHNYYYQVTAVYEEGESGPSNESTAFMIGIEQGNSANTPVDFALKQNYPNPFNPGTLIRFDLPKSTYVSLNIFNLLGQKIRTLIAEQKAAGYYNIYWDGQMDNGEKAASGVYVFRLQAEAYVKSRKMLLLR